MSDSNSRIKLKKLLKKVDSSGHFAVSGEAPELPILPGLCLHGYGPISLPLTNSQSTHALIKMCSQAPYGKGYDTVVDKNVRDTYELQPSSIEFKNPQWDVQLSKLVEKVGKDLGCTSEITYKLYKMLLYEKGGHFKKHRDTEKENGMFATLVVQLPSVYEGGEFILTHCNMTAKYDFGQSTGKAPYMCHYTAHYADVEHEILELKNGYRLVLVYSLCWTRDKNESVQILYKAYSDLTNEIANTLMCLKDNDEKIFSIYLNHEYTVKSLREFGIKALKGIDVDRARILKNANSTLPDAKQFNFHIVNSKMYMDERCDPQSHYEFECHFDDEFSDEYDDEEENSESESEDDEGEHEYRHARRRREASNPKSQKIKQKENHSSDEDAFKIDETKHWLERFNDDYIKEWYAENGDVIVNSEKDGCKLKVEFLPKPINPNADSKMRPWLRNLKIRSVEFMGNAGTKTTTTYQRFFLVMILKANEEEVLKSIKEKLSAKKE